jgi:cytochrome c553
MKSVIKSAVIFSLVLFTASNHAESLYITQVKKATWDQQVYERTVEMLEAHQPIEFAEPLKVSPFHNQQRPEEQADRDFCISCHTVYPHSNSERYRSYLNMHVSYLSCASCHFRPENTNFEYRWHEWATLSDGQESNTRHIIPFYRQGAETMSRQHPEIRAMLDTWEKSDLNQKVELHLKIHTPLEQDGPQCDACHTDQNSVLDYQALGYSAEEIKTIQENRISKFLSDEQFKDKPIKLMDLLQ